MIEVVSWVLIGFFGVDDSERDGGTEISNPSDTEDVLI